MIGNVELKDNGDIITEGVTVSLYQPSKEIKDITGAVQTDYQIGHNIMTDSYREFNDMNVFNRQDRDQKAFNSYVSPPSSDPDEVWRYNGMRPLSRNKAMVMAAHVTARLLYGNVDAQNDKDESDKIWATAMKDMVLWNIENSDYEMSFFFSVIAALVNPCAWVKEDFVEATQKIRVRLEDGTIDIQEAVDNVMTGMNFFNIPVDEMLISNIREYEVQRQRFLIGRRFIDFQEAKAKWGHHKNFKHVKPGVNTFFNDQDGLFYEQKDEQLQGRLVEEVTYYNRQEDIEIPFVSSIYLGDDDVENNPMKHRDNENKPRYQYVKFGFSPIDERQFFYYKSLMFSLENEQDLLDVMTRLVVDGAILDVNNPIGVIGGDRIDSSVIFPSAVTVFDEDTKIIPLKTGSNIGSGLSVIREAEASAGEVQSSFTTPDTGGDKTAFQVAREETNARIQLGAFGKLIGPATRDLTYLMLDDIVHHQTTPILDEILGENTALKYKTFLLPDQTEDGRKVTKKIRFTDKFLGVEKNEEDMLNRSFKLLEEEGGMDGEIRIFELNPIQASKLRFKVSVNPDNLLPQGELFEKAMKLEARDRMIASPLADIEAVERDFLFDVFAPGESDKYMKPLKEVLGQGIPQEGLPIPEKPKSELVSQITGSGELSELIRK